MNGDENDLIELQYFTILVVANNGKMSASKMKMSEEKKTFHVVPPERLKNQCDLNWNPTF